MNHPDLSALPHSEHAEAALIGGLMLDNKKFDDVSDLVEPADFYLPQHRELYAAICALARNDRPFDPVTVIDELQRTGRLEAAGEMHYLGTLVNETPSAENVPHYARTVAKYAKLRRIGKACGEGQARALSPGEADPDTPGG